MYTFIQYVNKNYESYAKDKKTSYEEFYNYLSNEEHASASANMRKNFTYALAELFLKIKRAKENEDKFYSERKAGLQRILIGFTSVFVVVILALVAAMFIVIRSYSTQILKASKMVIVFGIIIAVLFTLFYLLLQNIELQKTQQRNFKGQLDTATLSFETVMYGIGTDGEIANKEKFADVLIFLHERQSKPKDSEKLTKALENQYNKGRTDKSFSEMLINTEVKDQIESSSDNKIIQYYWNDSVFPTLKNLHMRGTGLKVLRALEMKSNNQKILKSVNEVLGNYYSLMLKERKSPDDVLSKDGILKVIDSVVVKRLESIDMFSLHDESKLSDEELLRTLKTKENYVRLMSGFKYLLIYMYPTWSTTSYKELQKLEDDKQGIESTYKTLAIDSNRKEFLSSLVSRDPSLAQVRDNFPIKREGFVEELERLEQYGNSVETSNEKEVIEDFIRDSISAFKLGNDTLDEKFLMKLSTTMAQNQKMDILTDYCKSFNAYFESLYKNLIKKDFAKLNPSSSQYFFFQKTEMINLLQEFVNTDIILQRLPDNYRTIMIDIIVNNLMEEQKQRFITDYFDFSNPDKAKDKNLKTLVIQTEVNDAIQHISEKISSFDIKLSDYSKYILTETVGKAAKDNLVVIGTIENIITQVDYEISLNKGLNKSSLGKEAEESRYVLLHSFMKDMDDMKFATFKTALRVDTLRELVRNLDYENSDTFLEKEHSAKVGKVMFRVATFISVLSYLLYGINTYETMSKDNEFKTNESTSNAYMNYVLKSDITINAFIKFAVPIAAIALFLSVFSSYVTKAEANIKFNKEIMKENTETIKTNVEELKSLIDEISSGIHVEKQASKIGALSEFDDNSKIKLYELMKNILTNFDKCNYILGRNKYELPFPYAEVVADGLMIVLTLGIMGYAISKFAPINRVVELKDLYEYRETAATLVNDSTFIKEITTKFGCHQEDVQSVMFTVKIISALSVVVFMILYSVKIVNANKVYESSLYNSNFLTTSNCCD
jgi:hypothetical protein